MIKQITGGIAVLGLLTVMVSAAGPAGANGVSYTAQLDPNPAVYPPGSKARGTAKFKLSADGRTLHYTINAFDLDPVSQIHIHVGEDAVTPEGEHYHKPPEEGHGHTVAFLLNFSPKGISGNGTVAQGKITVADLSGPFRKQPLKVLLDHMDAGWAYVNVHIFQDYGQGRRYCCPGGVRGTIRRDN